MGSVELDGLSLELQSCKGKKIGPVFEWKPYRNPFPERSLVGAPIVLG